MNTDENVRNFIIEATGGDQTVDLYDQWCEISDSMHYDHVSSNIFIMSTLEHSDPATVVSKIMNGFAVAAHSQAVNTGIVLNPALTYEQLLTWVKAMSSIGMQEDYSFITEILNADLSAKLKIQKIFELMGPGENPQYEDMLYTVEATTIDGLKNSIEEILSDPNVSSKKQKIIQEKLDLYSKFKSSIEGQVYSDRFSGLVGCYNMDIDVYLTQMKENIDFYMDSENWQEFFIDVWGCLILSNTKKEDYLKSLEAAVYEFFSDDVIRPKVLIEMNKATAKLVI